VLSIKYPFDQIHELSVLYQIFAVWAFSAHEKKYATKAQLFSGPHESQNTYAKDHFTN